MVKSDTNIIKIASKAGLTENDVAAIQRDKKKKNISKLTYLLVESIIGVSSFLIGYTIVQAKIIEVNYNYPFGSILLFGNSFVFSDLVKRKSLIKLIAITFFVFIFGFVLGTVTGGLFKFINVITYQGPPLRYGVYSFD
ncbi:MAG: hypothetical protein ACFFAU_01690 [Candidatus Hodarchaeota archaeon]